MTLPLWHVGADTGGGVHPIAYEWATLNWVDWFNNRRLLEPIGNIPPAEAKDNYYLQVPESAMSA